MKTKYRLIISVVLVAVSLLLLTRCPSKDEEEKTPVAPEKPVIYLYPSEITEVTVQLEYDGLLTVTYPAYNGGWNVTAYPDGTLENHFDGKEYSYLFWEGQGSHDFDFEQGFVVKGSDTATFLQETLAYIGLLPKEYNEFIVYWLPKMQENPYNLISFQGNSYTDYAKLDIAPAPDSILRVFMTYKPLDKPIEVPEQVFQPFQRSGFTVIEWGGSIIE